MDDTFAKMRKDGADPEEIAAEVSRLSSIERSEEGPKRDHPEPHDLEAISGIGDMTASRLRENGVTTIRQIARMSEARAEELGVKAEWIEAAKEMVG